MVEARDPSRLAEVLANDVVFHSPLRHKHVKGKFAVTLYLTSAMKMFSEGTFEYVREVVDGNDAVLEFHAVLDETEINGIDMIRVDSEGKITDFKVMIRPYRALTLVGEKMRSLIEGRG